MGRRQSEATKAKLRAIKRQPLSASTKAKIAKSREGKALSSETKAKISAALRGKHHHHKGHGSSAGHHHHHPKPYV